MLTAQQPPAAESAFDDGVFVQVCHRLQDANEYRVTHNISAIIVPSAKMLAMRGDVGARILFECHNEARSVATPLFRTAPQPDKAFGLA
jgi:hypothetical protein